MIPVIEQCTVPLLQFVASPQDIEFDDDIIFFISSLLKKSKSCNSQILRDAFQYLPLFHAKFNHTLGPLLECLSLYMLYSRVND